MSLRQSCWLHRFVRSPALVPVVVLVYVACATETDTDGTPAPAPVPYDLLCPSAARCADANGPLLVGVGVRDITPVVKETFSDCGADGICPGDPGYTAPDAGESDGLFEGHFAIPDGPEAFDDVNGNGLFDAVWIAGYDNARPAQGEHDPLWARALVVRKGSTTLALVAVDFVGYFFDEVQRIRGELDPALGIDHLLISSTHTHQGPDTVGIWGFDEGHTGVDAAYMATVRQKIQEAIADAVASLAEATVTSATGSAGGHPIPTIQTDVGVNNVLEDYRDPVVMDEEVRLLHFRRQDDDSVIATLINWANHPESLCSRNSYLSSDFVHYLREAVEQGVHRAGVDTPGIGGVAIFVNGAVGGMQSPGHIRVYDLDGTQMTETCQHTASESDPFFARPRAIGQLVGLDALRILRDNGELLAEDSLDFSFASKAFKLQIENSGYHAMFLTGVFYGACEYHDAGTTVPRRCIYDFDESRQVTADNLPSLMTEVSVINLGPVQMITAPGEMLPEYFLGGYDGSHVGPHQQLIDSWQNQDNGVPATCADDAACSPAGDAECAGIELMPGRVCTASNCCCTGGTCRSIDHNPPDLTKAPPGPYLRDRMTRRVKWILGLTPDELGYIIPPYNYQLDGRVPYVEQARGDHYEETNSVGVQIGPTVEKNLIGLLEAAP